MIRPPAGQEETMRVLIITIGCLMGILMTGSGACAGLAESPRSRRVIQRVGPELERRCREQGVTLGDPVFIRIFKQEKQLEIWLRTSAGYHCVETFPIACYSGDLGPKTRQGDLQAPEGFYWVVPERMNPWSRFHLSFDIGYPNPRDRQLGYTGGLIMVHGSDVSIGCFAMTDPGIERIYTYVHEAFVKGQSFIRIHIFPFRMTDAAMDAHADSPNAEFWKNLKTGYDFFTRCGVEPDVHARNGVYSFEVPADLRDLVSDDSCQSAGPGL